MLGQVCQKLGPTTVPSQMLAGAAELSERHGEHHTDNQKLASELVGGAMPDRGSGVLSHQKGRQPPGGEEAADLGPTLPRPSTSTRWRAPFSTARKVGA